MFSYKHILVSCAALGLAAALLAGCTAPASSLSTPSAAGSGSSSVNTAASAPADVPASSPAGSGAGSLTASQAASAYDKTPAAFDGLDDALTHSLGWGGDAGSSLKSMIAACALADWAEDAHAAALDKKALVQYLGTWLSALDTDARTNFSDNWESVSSDADALVTDPASVADLLSDAGDPNQHDSYTAENWVLLKAAIGEALAAQASAA